MRSTSKAIVIEYLEFVIEKANLVAEILFLMNMVMLIRSRFSIS